MEGGRDKNTHLVAWINYCSSACPQLAAPSGPRFSPRQDSPSHQSSQGSFAEHIKHWKVSSAKSEQSTLPPVGACLLLSLSS
ncbi:hypothetical protein LEMLEM_LOCUS4271, partial [Lemmus lemmus]